MQQYKGFKYKIVKINGFNFYHLYNEKNEFEAEFISLNEVKEAINNKLKYGYWAY